VLEEHLAVCTISEVGQPKFPFANKAQEGERGIRYGRKRRKRKEKGKEKRKILLVARPHVFFLAFVLAPPSAT